MSWKWPHNPRYSTEKEKVNTITLLVGLLIIILSSLWFRFGHEDRQTVLPVDVQLQRAARVIVIRFPNSVSTRQEEISIIPETERVITVIRVVVGQPRGGPVLRRYLSGEQWAAWNSLRLEWCTHPRQERENSEPVFQVGINCPDGIGQKSSYIFRIPPNALPAALRTLLQEIPSPSCEDPLCGW